MGVRTELFLLPVTDVFDYAWYELDRLSNDCHTFKFAPLTKVKFEIDLFMRSIERFVDPRLVSGGRKVGGRSKPSVALGDRVCEIWNSIRATILWVSHRVDNGQLPSQILVDLLRLNKQMASLIRLVNPVLDCGTQRFTIKETTEVPPIEVIKVFRRGYVEEYASQKMISPAEVPLASVCRQWKLPLNGWTRDLAEEAGKLIGDIESSSPRKVTTPVQSESKRKADRLADTTFMTAAGFLTRVEA